MSNFLVPQVEVDNNKKYKINIYQIAQLSPKILTDTYQSYTIWLYEKVTQKKNYPRIILGSYPSLENGQYLLQRPVREPDSDINIFRLHFTYDKAHSHAFRKAETKALNKSFCYKAC